MVTYTFRKADSSIESREFNTNAEALAAAGVDFQAGTPVPVSIDDHEANSWNETQLAEILGGQSGM